MNVDHEARAVDVVSQIDKEGVRVYIQLTETNEYRSLSIGCNKERDRRLQKKARDSRSAEFTTVTTVDVGSLRCKSWTRVENFLLSWLSLQLTEMNRHTESKTRVVDRRR